MEIKKAWAALAGAVFSFMAWVPQHVQIATWGAVALMVADLITGLTVAWSTKALSSSEMRRKTLIKCSQYLGLSTIFLVAAALSGQWNLAYAAPLSICGIEALSIWENLVLLQEKGVNLGPVAPVVKWLAQGFARSAAALVGMNKELQDVGSSEHREGGPMGAEAVVGNAEGPGGH